MDQNHQSRLDYVKNLTQDVSCRNKVSRVRFMHVKINRKIKLEICLPSSLRIQSCEANKFWEISG